MGIRNALRASMRVLEGIFPAINDVKFSYFYYYVRCNAEK